MQRRGTHRFARCINGGFHPSGCFGQYAFSLHIGRMHRGCQAVARRASAEKHLIGFSAVETIHELSLQGWDYCRIGFVVSWQIKPIKQTIKKRSALQTVLGHPIKLTYIDYHIFNCQLYSWPVSQGEFHPPHRAPRLLCLKVFVDRNVPRKPRFVSGEHHLNAQGFIAVIV